MAVYILVRFLLLYFVLCWSSMFAFDSARIWLPRKHSRNDLNWSNFYSPLLLLYFLCYLFDYLLFVSFFLRASIWFGFAYQFESRCQLNLSSLVSNIIIHWLVLIFFNFNSLPLSLSLSLQCNEIFHISYFFIWNNRNVIDSDHERNNSKECHISVKYQNY